MPDRSRSASALVWLAAGGVFALDQASKALVLARYRPDDVHVVAPRVLEWVLVHNTRGAYGLFGDRPWFLVTISLIAFAVIFLAFRERAARLPGTAIALGCVLGGAIGNVVDRLHHGFVVDFIRVPLLPFFEVFNVADTGISLGIAAIVLMSARPERISERGA